MHRAPDQRLDLSFFRTPSPSNPIKFHLAVKIPAIAMIAGLSGAAGVWATAAAPPAPLASPGVQVRHLATDTAQAAPPAVGTSHAHLDAFLQSTAPAATPRPALTPRQIALSLLPRFGWSRWQFPYLDRLWSRESGWHVHAENVYSGAYGIPQAVPGVKMSSAGPNWRTSARTQILWGLRYIKGRYGSPARAWAHELATGWY